MVNNATISNKKANFEYFILDTEIVGIMLNGSEIRPLREGKAGIAEAFIWIDIENFSINIKNMYIKNDINNAYSHEEYRERKLLMTKKQLVKWYKEIGTKGVTIVPLKGYFNEKGKYKLEVALVKGKKIYDKRNVIKDKDVERDIKRELKK